MKRLLLSLAAFVLTIGLYGVERSESSAAAIAARFLKSEPSLGNSTRKEIVPQLVYQIEREGETAVYVYGNNVAKGFVLVSGDDAVIPILGYSNAGNFDYSNMPENAKWWIDNYANQIQAIKEGKAKAAVVTKSSTAVAPLLGETVWGQDVPYNALTPSYNEKNCPTGCVATAMAQVMYYHKWPETGKGSKSYTSKTYKFELSADFSKSTYLWNKMTPVYNEQSNPESKDAVAKLMFDCGVAIEMDYDPAGSGALSKNTAKAFIENFSYDKGIRLLHRSFYTIEEWATIMKSELNAFRPILYGGKTGTGLFAQGHEFVCDGYNTQGLFHINWGWNGTSNGYFLLSALNPDEQGTGGSSPSAGYNFGQQALVGIQKPTANPVDVPYFLTLPDDNGCKVEDNDLRVSGAIFNGGYGLFNGTIYAELTDTLTGKGAVVQEIMTGEIKLDFDGQARQYSEKITLPSTLRGTYKLNFYSVDKNGIKLEVRTSALKPIITISDQGIIIKNRYSGLVVSDVKVKIQSSSSIMSTYSCTYNLTNTGEHDILKENKPDSYMYIQFECDNSIVGRIEEFCDLKKGETITVERSISVPAGNVFSIYFYDYFSNNLYGDIFKMNIPEYMIFLLEKATIKNAQEVDSKDFQLDAIIKNISGEEGYDGNVYAKIFRTSDNQEMGVITTSAKAAMDQSIDVSFIGELDLATGGYYAVLYYDLENNPTAVFAEDVENMIPFNVTITGIEDQVENNMLKLYPNPAHDYIVIETDNEPEYVRVFNAEGALLIEKKGVGAKNIQIDHLTNGIYIVSVNCSGKVVTGKIVKQ